MQTPRLLRSNLGFCVHSSTTTLQSNATTFFLLTHLNLFSHLLSFKSNQLSHVMCRVRFKSVYPISSPLYHPRLIALCSSAFSQSWRYFLTVPVHFLPLQGRKYGFTLMAEKDLQLTPSCWEKPFIIPNLNSIQPTIIAICVALVFPLQNRMIACSTQTKKLEHRIITDSRKQVRFQILNLLRSRPTKNIL